MSPPQVPPLSDCPAPAAVGVDASCTLSAVAMPGGKGMIPGSCTCRAEGKGTNPGTRTLHFSRWEDVPLYYFIPTWINRLPAQGRPRGSSPGHSQPPGPGCGLPYTGQGLAHYEAAPMPSSLPIGAPPFGAGPLETRVLDWLSPWRPVTRKLSGQHGGAQRPDGRGSRVGGRPRS